MKIRIKKFHMILTGIIFFYLILPVNSENDQFQESIKKVFWDRDTIYTIYIYKNINEKIKEYRYCYMPPEIQMLRVIKLKEDGIGTQYKLLYRSFKGPKDFSYDFAEGIIFHLIDTQFFLPSERRFDLKKYQINKMDKYYQGLTIKEDGKILIHSLHSERYRDLSPKERFYREDEEKDEVSYGTFRELDINRTEIIPLYYDLIALDTQRVLFLLHISDEKTITVWSYDGVIKLRKVAAYTTIDESWQKECIFSAPSVGPFKAVHLDGTLYLFYAEGIFSVNIAEAKKVKDTPIAAKEISKNVVDTIVFDNQTKNIYLSSGGVVYNINDINKPDKTLPIPEVEKKLTGEEAEVARLRAIVKTIQSLQGSK